MEIVVELPDEYYKALLGSSHIYLATGGRGNGKTLISTVLVAVANGTPLPQPFDLDGLKSDMKALNCGYPYGLDYLLDCLKKRLGITISEADKQGGTEQ